MGRRVQKQAGRESGISVVRPFVGVTEKRGAHFDYIVFLRKWEINVLPFSLHGFHAPFPALLFRVIAGYPMQTVIRFSRCNGQNGNKKTATKQTSPAFAFLEGHASRLCNG